MNDSCVRCGAPAVHTHHRKLRSQGGDNSPANLLRLCLSCHGDVHLNPAEAYEQGYLVHSWDDPASVPVFSPSAISDEDAEWMNAAMGPLRPEVEPGSTCDRCHRRVPHPKKPSSPKTKVFSVRIPLDELEPWEEALDAAASHLGLGTAPHHRFQALNAGLALILQGPKGLLE